jgi:hypothetical protein
LRLTLRTLLAYLDDTLDAAQVKQIGQKVAESDTAQELIARIKQVTRRRRLTTPPTTGPGSKIDPNTIAEYLENKLSEDQVAEVEQICLGSDVHLAELAACHQLLTLILGEPLLIPPTSRQRMYGLVKGRESIPFRKPKPEPGTEEEEVKSSEDSYQQDETLRMGLPAWRKRSSWASRMTLVGGALAACLLLALAIYQALKPPALPEQSHNNGKEQTGTAPGKDKDTIKNKTAPVPPDTSTDHPKSTTSKAPTPAGNGSENPVPPPAKFQAALAKTAPAGTGQVASLAKLKTPENMTANAKSGAEATTALPSVPVVAIKPASQTTQVAGDFERSPLPNEPEILLQKLKPDRWHMVHKLKPKVETGSPLVSLPGYQSVIALKKPKDDAPTLKLKLIGALPEETPAAGLARESMVELHAHDQLDLDMTLHRGKVLITNLKDKPAHIRLRFANTTDPDLGEVWDLVLIDKGTEIFAERTTAIPPGEPFYLKANHTSRKGPVSAVHVVVREGNVLLRREKVTYHLQKPPGDARFYWVSTTGVGKEKLTSVPDYASDKAEVPAPDLPKEADPKVAKQIMDFHQKFLEMREKMKKARFKLMNELLGSPDKIETVLKSMVKSDQVTERVLAVRCYGAVDRLDALVDALGVKDFIDVRRTAIETLRRWISYERDNDYQLYKQLTDNSLFSSADADSLITMLHGFSAKEALTSPALYEAIIPRLNDDKLAMRELAFLQLYLELQKFLPQPVGLEINYGPEAPPEVRAKAVTQWTELLAAGKLPPKVK